MNILERITKQTAGMPLSVMGANRLRDTSDSTTSGSSDGYVNGSDILLSVGGGCISHCSTHNVQYNTETKERAVKAEATKSSQTALFTSKGVTKLTITAHGEGFRFYQGSENGFIACANMWGKGQSVDLLAFDRGSDTAPYLKGKFVITSMEETNPANDDSTWTIDLENDGEPEIYPGKA